MTIKHLLHRLNRRDTRLFPKTPTYFKIIISILFLTGIVFLTTKVYAANQLLNNMVDDGGGGDASTSNLTTTTKEIDMTEFANGYSAKQDAIKTGNNQEAWTNESIASNGISLNQAIAGTIPIDVLTNQTTSWIPGGLIGFTNRSIASLYNLPVSGVQYIAETINNLTGKPTYAQTQNGHGFDRFLGILPLWKNIRDIVYTLVSLVFIIIGIMIILRIKISPQATITIQNSIPKIITTLILVTFSYAIAGLIVDISYVLLGLFLSLFESNIPLNPGETFPTTTTLMSLDVWGYFDVAKNIVPTGVMMGLGLLVGGVVGLIGGGWIGGVLGGVLGLLAIFIFILWQTIKLFFGIAKCYIILLIHIILAPFEIGIGAFPNAKSGFSTWLRQIISQAAVFPISIIFLVFSVFIVKSVTNSNSSTWAPGFIGGGNIAGPIVGLACLGLVAKLPQLIPEMIDPKSKNSAISKAIGDTYKAPIGLATSSLKKGAAVGINAWGKTVENKHAPTSPTRPTNWQKFRASSGRLMQSISGMKH